MVSTKAQASMEYLLITAAGFLLLTPVILFFATQSQTIQSDVTNAQAYRVAQSITNEANNVYYQGYPATTTFEVHFPAGIQSVSFNNTVLTLQVQNQDRTYPLQLESDTNLTGTIEPFQGLHVVTVIALRNGTVRVTET